MKLNPAAPTADPTTSVPAVSVPASPSPPAGWSSPPARSAAACRSAWSTAIPLARKTSPSSSASWSARAQSVGRSSSWERRLTDRPILWLANTVYHGDHTFGNAAFPTTTRIIASRQTAASMTDLDAEKRARAQNLHGNLEALAEVTSWRRPDVAFDDRAEVDLGGRTVQLWHFGPGNSPGDTVVWVPEVRAGWTGNLLGHRRVAPMLLEGGPTAYIETLARFKSTLDVRTIVPGHGPLADARALDAWMAYLRELLEAVTRARRLGLSALATVETVPLPHGHGFPRWHPAARLNRLVHDLHRLNVLATYRQLERRPTLAAA